MLVELTEIQRLHIHFCWKVEDEDVQALALLRLIDATTREEDVKELKYILDCDDLVRARRFSAWVKAQDAAKSEGREDWCDIGDDEFTVLDAVKEMTDEERRGVRARALAVRR